MTSQRGASPEEMDEAYSGPAPGVNKFVLTLGATGLRVAFMEEINGKAYFRNAVTMHPQDGLRFRDLISNLLADVEEQIRSLEAQDGGSK